MDVSEKGKEQRKAEALVRNGFLKVPTCINHKTNKWSTYNAY